MDQPRKLLAQSLDLLLPAILICFLILVVRNAEMNVREWNLRKTEADIRREGVRYEETIRTAASGESLVSRMVFRFRRRLLAALRMRGRWGRGGPPEFWNEDWIAFSVLRAAGDSLWPGRRFPESGKLPRLAKPYPLPAGTPGVSLYVFLGKGDGKFTPVSGRGLARENSRLMAGLIGMLLAGENLDPAELRAAQKRCVGVFGKFCPFELLAERRGRPTLGRFRNRKSFITWDLIEVPEKAKLGYLLVFPQRDVLGMKPLWRAINGRLPGAAHGGVPVLVPKKGSYRPLRPIPASKPLTEGMRAFLRGLDSLENREKRFPPQVLTPFGNLFVFRGFLALHSSFETWVLFPRPFPGKSSSTPVSDFMSGLMLLAASVFAARVFIFGELPSFRLKLWLPGIIGLVGALPLTALYLVGTMQIEISRLREIQSIQDGARARLEAVDRGNSGILPFLNILSRYMRMTPGWNGLLVADSDGALTEAASQAFSFFERQGYPLRALLEFPLIGNPRMVVRNGGRLVTGDLRHHGAYQAIFQGCADVFGLTSSSASDDGGADSRDLIRRFFSSLGLSFTGSGSSRERMVTGLGNVLQSMVGMGKELAFVDFLTREGAPHSFLTLVFASKRAYATWMGKFLARENAGVMLPSAIVMGCSTIRGFLPLFPGPRQKYYGRYWRTGFGRRMRSLLEDAASNHSPQSGEYGRAFFLAIPCRDAPGFFLGIRASLEGPFARAEASAFFLRCLILVILGTIMMVGFAISRHLISPLEEVRNGLLGVASGDLAIRVQIDRDDELGFLTSSFDEMTRGLRRRQELGRFVSGTLDSSVSMDDGGVEGPRVREGAVLVSDLRSFTTLSESHPPESVVAMLNTHLEEMALCISAHEGAIEKFIGDAVIAVFFDRPDGSSGHGASGGAGLRRALLAASAMRRKHSELQARRARIGVFGYEMGVGIAHGPILSGPLKTTGRREFAVLGKTRKLAEKLESASRKGTRTRIVVSEETAVFSKGECFGNPIFVSLPGGREWELAELLETAPVTTAGPVAPRPQEQAKEPPSSDGGGR